ncbi:hypothetical protein L202_08219 [Cryptococcus amylolentus CBS 6039]|uniref:Uncharacterized protein n=2 Tax=Cryptococcus amylolentus TaxID=104669 RepID=A0A1E3H919_9TREE|nr:hypothetical protein L202_08219 [Cryptococcus amylolentus CBS 6039]ODN72784.1 hypothetical protein L202_08219 [Cryptococcus amylolentus CBS 6039]ODN97984.1 hypothetical protein I350_07621 [Cryptococcus amylolentus CBS 6273]
MRHKPTLPHPENDGPFLAPSPARHAALAKLDRRPSDTTPQNVPRQKVTPLQPFATPPRDNSLTPSLDSAKSDALFTPAQNVSGASPLVRSLVSGDLHSDSRQIGEPVKAQKKPHFWHLTPSPWPSSTLDIVSLAERFEGLDVDMEIAQPPSPEQTPSPLPKPVELKDSSKPLPFVDPRLKLYPFILPPGLWDVKSQPDANGVEHETRPLLPVKPIASSSPVDPCTPASPSPRIFQDPSASKDYSRLRNPSPLLNHSPTATLHLSTTVPYAEAPGKQGQLCRLFLPCISTYLPGPLPVDQSLQISHLLPPSQPLPYCHPTPLHHRTVSRRAGNVGPTRLARFQNCLPSSPGWLYHGAELEG